MSVFDLQEPDAYPRPMSARERCDAIEGEGAEAALAVVNASDDELNAARDEAIGTQRALAAYEIGYEQSKRATRRHEERIRSVGRYG